MLSAALFAAALLTSPVKPTEAGQQSDAEGGAGREAAAASPDLDAEAEAEAAVREVTGIEEQAHHDGDLARDVGDAILWLPRTTIDLAFRGAEAAANILAEEQLVPRYNRLLGIPEGGEFFFFPTLFAETGSPFNVGLRMIANTRHVTTSQRFGIGGLDDWVMESRVLLDGGATAPVALSLEAFGRARDGLEYQGLGSSPITDARNAFLPGRQGAVAHYREERSRFIASLGVRLTPELELYASSSGQQRRIRRSDPEDGASFDEVFVPGSVPGVNNESWINYSELAARFDSRATRGRPVPGVLLEGYGGAARSLTGAPVAFLRIGWRIASFVPVYRRSNILAAKVVFDRVVPLSGLPVPFTELPRQPEFRGIDDRRDFVSVVGSLDYTWLLVPILGMRTFVDGAVVAPSVTGLGFDALERLHIAAGFGLDVFSDTARIAQALVAGTPDGPRFLLRFGTPNGYGDRQHRD